MQTWDKLDSAREPQPEAVAAYVGSPLWTEILQRMEEIYGCRPKAEYSGCSMQAGWNYKLKKGGRSLCTLYPLEGGFRALVVVGQREKAETELALPACTAYTRQLYRDAKEGVGQRWLMFDVADKAVLADVLRLVAIRRRPPE